MDIQLVKETYEEYITQRDEIFRNYGEKDGFVISGVPWWEYYSSSINDIVTKYKQDTLKESEVLNFYKSFGFAPKLYPNTFVENGIEKIGETFLFILDETVDIENKILEIVDDPESPYNLKGVGINFVTLFLTVIFPHKCSQWNKVVDEALKIIGAYPEIPRGTKNPQKYLLINNSVIEVSKIIGESFLPVVDNYLFSLVRGYIGKDAGIQEIVEKEVKELEDDIEEKKIPKQERKKYLEIQYLLIRIGRDKGYDVWVASNDRKEIYDGHKFSELSLESIPSFASPRTINIAKWVDVIFFMKDTNKPVRFFEIEHSTSIYSGLLRLSDILIDYPIPKASIVIPEERLKKVEREMDRPTFKELSEVCDFMTYDEVREWYKAIIMAKRFD